MLYPKGKVPTVHDLIQHPVSNVTNPTLKKWTPEGAPETMSLPRAPRPHRPLFKTRSIPETA